MLGLLDTSNNQDNGSNGITGVLLGDGSLQLLESGIKDKESFVLLSNAGKKGEDIELSSEGLEESLLNLSELNFVSGSSELEGRLSTEDGLGGGFSDVNTKFLPVSIAVLSDGIFDFREDIGSIDHKILTNVVSEGGRARKDLSHLGKLLPVSLKVGAVGHALLNSLQDVGNLLILKTNPIFTSHIVERSDIHVFIIMH